MPHFKITNRVSGMVLGIFPGEDERDALNAMARDAGYRDYTQACNVVGATEDDGELLVEIVDEEDAEDVIQIKITPTLGVVFYLSDLADTEKALWLGEEVPSSAAPRLAQLQTIVTKRISEAMPGAVVEWSAESVHRLGGPRVHVSIDDDVDEGFSHALVEGRVNVILNEEIAHIVKEILNK